MMTESKYKIEQFVWKSIRLSWVIHKKKYAVDSKTNENNCNLRLQINNFSL